ncbi:restriction endonuclease subunit S [Pediococcus pentosaceus]|uniref:restriction endonuclease subunit S n=1 Tax=Pediococcus pentosaceus TaxID=1255 RepID=UPI00338D9720
MKDKQTKYSQLRFKGFTNPWEKRKLGEIAKVQGGGTPSSSNSEYWDGGINWFTPTEVSNSGYLSESNRKISELGLAKSSAKVLPVGTVLMTSRAGVGDMGILTQEAATNQGFQSLIPDEGVPSYFLYSMQQSISRQANRLASGSTFTEISGKQVAKIPEWIPTSHEERRKVGDFFANLDNLIAVNQRKLAKLKELKQGYLQKLFPRNGSKFPQLRFAGFADAWKERKLGDVVGEIQSGNRLPKDSLTNGDVPYVVAQTKNDGVFKKIARGTLDYNGNPMKLFPGNSISFSIDNPEAMFYRNAEFYTSNIMRVIHEDHLTHEQYVFILENMKRFIRGYDWSRKFSGPVVSNLEYLQPSEEEQQKIGSFFKQLDDTITLHQRKLEKLQELKKGYLQKMFC